MSASSLRMGADAFAVARIVSGLLLAPVLFHFAVVSLWAWSSPESVARPLAWGAAAVAALPPLAVAVGFARSGAARVCLVSLLLVFLATSTAGPDAAWQLHALGLWAAVALVFSLAPAGESFQLRAPEAAAEFKDWQLGPRAVGVAWVLLGVGHALGGLAGGIERFAGPLVALGCMWPPTRRIAWGVGAAFSLVWMSAGIEPELRAALLALHALTLDERWWPRAPVSEPHPVVFFDGVCGLCNTSVDWLLRRDPEGVFLFAPMQWDSSAVVLGAEKAAALDGVILRDAEGLHEGSTALLRILNRLGGVWRLVAALRAVPRPLRDAVYFFVARHRYAWFGVKAECRLPRPEERSRFLA